MKRLLQTHRGFIAALAGLVAILAAEAAWVLDQQREAVVARQELARGWHRWRTLAGSVPPPTQAEAERLQADDRRAATTLAGLRSQVPVNRPMQPSSPDDRAQAFFRVAGVVASARAAMREAGIGMADGESFGFASYARSGPHHDDIPAVNRQLELIGTVVRALVEARPLALHGIARERPRSGGPAAAGVAADFFVMDESKSVRRSGLIDSWALQVAFIGHTRTLRRFLEELDLDRPMFVVRDIAVDPAPESAEQSSEPPAGGPAGAVAPIIKATPSRFIITLEAVERAAVEPDDQEDVP